MSQRARVTMRILVCVVAWALVGPMWAAPYVEPRTGLEFPDECGGWVRTGEHVYEQAELGVSVSYTNDQQKTLTAYAYGGGVTDLPTGGDSEVMLRLTAQTAAELKEVWKERGGEVEEILPSAVIREEPSGKGLATIVAHRIVMKGQVLITISGLTGYRGTIMKVRYTYARSPLDEGIADLKRFVVGLLTANRGGLDGHFGEVAAQYAPIEPMPTRQEFAAAVRVLDTEITGQKAAEAAGVVIRFVERSEEVAVTLGREVAPWVMEVPEEDAEAQEMSALLLAAYLGANAEAQLASGERKDHVLAGWKAALATYRKMRDAGRTAIAALEELVDAEHGGKLEQKAREAQERLNRE